MSEPALTWAAYIRLSATRLAAAETHAELAKAVADIDLFIADKNTPPDFWSSLKSAYDAAPKTTRKEAAAAASLNALVLSAQALIAVRAKGK
jgi:hypothetical protein